MSIVATVRKADWLNEFRALLIAGLVLIPLFATVQILMVVLGGEVVAEVPADPAGPREFTVGGQSVRHRFTEVAIADPTPAQAMWYLGTRLPSAIVLVAALILLLRLVRRARRDNPFTRDTVRDLRRLGVVLLVGGSLAGLVESVATVGLSIGLADGTISGSWEFPVVWLFAGFAVLAIGQIVARGCAMREELDEVI